MIFKISLNLNSKKGLTNEKYHDILNAHSMKTNSKYNTKGE